MHVRINSKSLSFPLLVLFEKKVFKGGGDGMARYWWCFALHRLIIFSQSSGDQTLAKSAILKETKTIFEQLRDDPNAKIVATNDQMELYTEARTIEQRNRDE